MPLMSRGESALVLDARDLKYISSAGLRVILAIQKGLSTKISIINLSPEVLDIFQMEGFPYLMDVKGGLGVADNEGYTHTSGANFSAGGNEHLPPYPSHGSLGQLRDIRGHGRDFPSQYFYPAK
jgi:hypothetical protein